MSTDSSYRYPNADIDAYRRMSRKTGKVWREHGALDYGGFEVIVDV